MRKIDRYTADEIAYSIDGDLRDDYSGRSMYGETCFGIVVDGEASLVELGLAIGTIPESDLSDSDKYALVRSVRTDSMGLGTIVYFPGWQIEDEDDNTESELN